MTSQPEIIQAIQAAVALNNHGISLCEKKCLSQAHDALREAAEVTKLLEALVAGGSHMRVPTSRLLSARLRQFSKATAKRRLDAASHFRQASNFQGDVYVVNVDECSDKSSTPTGLDADSMTSIFLILLDPLAKFYLTPFPEECNKNDDYDSQDGNNAFGCRQQLDEIRFVASVILHNLAMVFWAQALASSFSQQAHECVTKATELLFMVGYMVYELSTLVNDHNDDGLGGVSPFRRILCMDFATTRTLLQITLLEYQCQLLGTNEEVKDIHKGKVSFLNERLRDLNRTIREMDEAASTVKDGSAMVFAACAA